MGLVALFRARMRALIGEQVRRQVPRRSSKPRIGGYVVHVEQGFRLIAQAGMSDELWHWLMDRGWRVESHRPDRREYRDIPATYVTELIDAEPAQREQALADAMTNARPRPAGRGQHH